MKKKSSLRFNRKVLIDNKESNNNDKNINIRASSRSITRVNSSKRSGK